MAHALLLNRTADPATGELQRTTPMGVILRIRNNLRPLFPVGKPNPPDQELHQNLHHALFLGPLFFGGRLILTVSFLG